MSKQNPDRARKNTFLVRLSDEEKAALEQKMERLGIRNREAFVRKMINDGYIIEIDTTPIAELARLFRISANNVHQVSKRANESGCVYEEDVVDLIREFNALKPLIVEANKIAVRLKQI